MQNDFVDGVVGKSKTGIAKELMDKATAALGGQSDETPAHGFRSTHVNHHKDGSHTVTHSPYSGEETSYAVKDSAELTKKLKKYLGGKKEATEPADSPAEEKSEGEQDS